MAKRWWQGSARWVLDETDTVKIIKGAAIAATAAALTYLADAIPGADFGNWTPAVVAVFSVAINAARKWVADYTVSI